MAGQGGLLIPVGCYNSTAGYLDFYHCDTALKSCCSLTRPRFVALIDHFRLFHLKLELDYISL